MDNSSHGNMNIHNLIDFNLKLLATISHKSIHTERGRQPHKRTDTHAARLEVSYTGMALRDV